MTAIVLATAIPLALFVVWNAVILGTITSFEIGSDKIIDPLQQLQSANRVVGRKEEEKEETPVAFE
ncbi:unnamed protein product [Camellia sinensis]